MNDAPDTKPASSVLYVITKANWGGAQRYVFDLAQAAHEEGYRVTVAYGTPGLLLERLTQIGVPTISLSGLGRDVKLGSDFASFRALVQLLRETRPDVLHVNSSKAGALGALAGRLVGIPHIIFTAHGWAFNEARPWWQKIILKAIVTITILLSHRTICVSDAVKRDVTWVPASAKKLLVIKSGLARPIFKAREDARAALTVLFPRPLAATYWVGMIAELHPTKRIEDAITAVALLRTQHPDIGLVVLGDGGHRTVIEQEIVTHDAASHVMLAGFVADGASYLPAFDLFLLPSRTEALAYALIEAGHASLPSIATRAGGMPEVILHEETGLLVSVQNPHELADAISILKDDPEKASKYGQALNTHVETWFSREAMVKKTLALYQRL